MPNVNITSATTTSIDVAPGDHELLIHGTWGGTSAAVTRQLSGIGFDGVGPFTADPTSSKIITCSGQTIDIVTTGGTGIDLTCELNRVTPRT